MRWKGEAVRLPPFSFWQPFDTMRGLERCASAWRYHCEYSCSFETGRQQDNGGDLVAGHRDRGWIGFRL